MGWQDAPVIGGQTGQSASQSPAWMNAPLITQGDTPASFNQPDTLGNMGWFDPRAANASTKDFLLAHLAELGKGAGQLGQTAADYGRVAANTYGQGDSTLASLKALYADITGNARNPNSIANVITQQVIGQNTANDYLSNLAAAQRDTAAASGRLGTAGTIAANMTGGGPLGEVAGAIKAMLPAGRFAGPLAGAITGGGATAAGEFGRNESLSPWDIGVGTVIGGVGGAPAGKGGVAPAISADDLLAQAKQAYKPLSDVLYDATKEVHPAIDPIDAQNALRDWSGYKWNDATKTKGEINTLLNKPQLSANDLQQSQRYLKGIASDGRSDPNDAMYAAHYAGKLQDILDNATPQTGVPQNWSNPTNAPSFASAKKAEGDVLYGQAQDVSRLNEWIDKSKVAGGGAGTDVGSQASAYLRSDEGRRLAPPGSPQYDALNTLAGTAAKPSTVPWWVKHFVIAPAAGTAINEGVQAGTGEHESPLEHLGADLGIGAVLAGSMAGYGAFSGMRARAAQQRAIDAARSTLSTGNFQAPIPPDQPFRDAVRRLIFSQGAAGRLPGQ
jgi:hypothetical protein